MEIVKVLLYQKVGEVFKKEKIVEFMLENHVYPKIPQFVFPQKRQNLPPKNSLVSTMLGWVLEIVPTSLFGVGGGGVSQNS